MADNTKPVSYVQNLTVKKEKKKKKEDYNLGNCLCIRGVVVKPHINCSVSSEGKTTLLEIRESFW